MRSSSTCWWNRRFTGISWRERIKWRLSRRLKGETPLWWWTFFPCITLRCSSHWRLHSWSQKVMSQRRRNKKKFISHLIKHTWRERKRARRGRRASSSSHSRRTIYCLFWSSLLFPQQRKCYPTTLPTTIAVILNQLSQLSSNLLSLASWPTKMLFWINLSLRPMNHRVIYVIILFTLNFISFLASRHRLRSFGVKPILDYSVEEDLSQEEAEEREVAGTSSSNAPTHGDVLPQYSVDKNFADRRKMVQSARTYFYLNEATCEKNMETFIQCLEAVANSTFGTGITAIKLTALGRPQLLVCSNQFGVRLID